MLNQFFAALLGAITPIIVEFLTGLLNAWFGGGA